MSPVIGNRSVLHALAPRGLNTPEVESLTSYVCRLAHSHCMTATTLAAWILERFVGPVADDFKWCQRSFSSMSAESEQWAAWLAELTGVGDLDRLTLVPWQHCVGGTGIAPKSDRWCPACLAEDLSSGSEPYLRLAWDIAPVTVCTRHRVELASICPHCTRSNVRNRATVVVPGYCTACGGFLGDSVRVPATPEGLWAARQVGNMVARQPTLEKGGASEVLRLIIAKMAGGQAASFARQLGLSKSGVWHWVTKGGVPSLPTWLVICLHSGLSLDRLFAADLDGWVPPGDQKQLPIPLPEAPRKGIPSRQLDWESIRAELREILKLPDPITLGEACQRVGVEYKQLYLRANKEAREIADRYRRHRMAVKARREVALHDQLGEILNERLMAGYEGMSARDVRNRIDEELKSVRNSFELIRQVRENHDG